MKSLPLIFSILTLCTSGITQIIADSQLPEDFAAMTPHLSSRDQHINTLKQNCYERWSMMDWKIGQTDALARENKAFNEGINRICQARAELFMEGYEVSPFIADNSQEEVFPIVFQSSVSQIKEQLKLHLPKLRLI